MATQVGHAEVVLSLQDSALKRELTAAERKVLQTVRTIDSMRGEADIGLDISEVERKAAAVKAELTRLDRESADITVDVDAARAQAKLAELQAEAAALDGQKIKLDVELTTRRDLDRRLTSQLREVEQAAGAATSGIAAFASSLAQMNVRLGPLTGTARQLSIAFIGLAPAIAGAAGATLALGSAVGSGLLGVTAMAAAGLTGLALAGIGLVGVIKPLKDDFQAAAQAASAYDTAVRKYGKGSDEAADKLKQLRRVTRGLSPAAREAFQSFNQLGRAWQRMTAPARRALMETMGQGLRTVGALMPQFARRTNETSRIVSRAFNEMFAGLRSQGGRAGLDTIMGNFNASLRLALPGLNQLGAAFGKAMAAASKLLPGTARSFLEWATGVNQAASNTGKLEARMRQLGTAANATGRFFMSAGRLIASVMGAGTRSGVGLLDDLAAAMDRATAAVRGGAMDQFFARSAATARQLASALAPMLSSLGSFISLASPFSQTILTLLTPLNQFVATLLKLPALRAGLQGFATAFAGLFVIGKIAAAARGIMAMATAVRALGAAGVAANLGSAVAGLAGFSTAARPATVAMTGWGAAARGAAPAIAGVGTAASGLGPLLGALGVVAAGVGLGLLLAGKRSSGLADAISKANAAGAEGQRIYQELASETSNLAGAADSATAAVRSEAAARRELNRLMKEGKLHTKEGRQAADEYNATLPQTRAALQAEAKARQARIDKIQDGINVAKTERNALRSERDEIQRGLAGAHASGRGYADLTEGRRRLAAVNAALAVRERALGNAMAMAQLQTVNMQRELKHMPVLADSAARSLQRIAQSSNRQVATRIGVKVDTAGQADKIANLAEAANRLGGRSRVIKILANAGSAEDAVRRLRGLVGGLRDKQVNIKGNPKGILGAAAQAISRLAGIRDKTVRIDAQDNASGVISFVSNALAGLDGKTADTYVRTHYQTSVSGPTPFAGQRARASGKRSGERSERALVGEGRAPELLVNTKTGAAALVREPMILNLGRETAVVPTEPAYRDRGRAILREVAGELGIQQFARGRKPPKAKAKAKGKPQLPVPERYRFGGVPLTGIENEVQNLRSQIDERKRDKKSLGNLPGEVATKTRQLKALRAANARIERLGNQAEGFRSAMEAASNQGKEGVWKRAKRSRTSTLRGLAGWLHKAYESAPKGSIHRSRMYADWQRVRAELTGARDESFGTAEGPLDMEDFLKSIGQYGALQQRTLAVAMAGATVNDPNDDRVASAGLASFWEQIIGRYGGRMDTDLLAEAYNALGSARSGATSDLGSVDPTGDLQAQLDQANTRVRVAQNEAAINAAFAQVAGGPGDIDTGGFSSARQAAGASGLTQNIYTLHPGDPKTLQAIGSAAAAGFGYQGSRTSPREVMGV
jgi:hypothetical protein